MKNSIAILGYIELSAISGGFEVNVPNWAPVLANFATGSNIAYILTKFVCPQLGRVQEACEAVTWMVAFWTPAVITNCIQSLNKEKENKKEG